MTRKHFDSIAACLGGAYAEQGHHVRTLADVTARLIVELRLDNPRFSEDRFRARVEDRRRQHGGTV